MNAEGRPNTEYSIRVYFASMRPRSVERGRKLAEIEKEIADRSSMRPRSVERGRALTSCVMATWLTFFNEAALS